MRIICAVLLIFLSLAILPAKAHEEETNIPGKFDYYLLNMSWEPEFCHTRRNASSDECRTDNNGFVLHGLWPQFTDGYPEHCSSAPGPTNPSALLDLMPTLWLAQHEWGTHGTCSGLSADNYFALMRQAYTSVHIPEQLVRPTHGLSLTPANIKQAFTAANPGLRSEDMAISCGNNYLTAVEICLSKDTLKPAPCGKLRDCRANIIHVAPVKGSSFTGN